MSAEKGNKYASFNNLDRILNGKKKETGASLISGLSKVKK